LEVKPTAKPLVAVPTPRSTSRAPGGSQIRLGAVDHRVVQVLDRIGWTSPDTDRTLPLSIGVQVAAAPADAQLLLEVGLCDHDARLDHDLADRDIDAIDQVADLRELGRRLGDDQRVRTLFHDHGAAAGDQAAALLRPGLEQADEIRGIGVANADELAAQGRQFGNLLVGLDLLALALGDFRRRSDHQHVADLALVQTLGLEHQLERLIPGHVFQAQGDAAGYGIRGNKVQLGEVGDQLQDRAHLDVLEVQRDTLADVGKLVATLLSLGLAQRLDADHVLVVGLVGEVVEIAGGLRASATVPRWRRYSHRRCSPVSRNL
jgi:hypothetical protein